MLIKEFSLPFSNTTIGRREANPHDYYLFPLLHVPLTIVLTQGLLHRDSGLLVHFELKNVEHAF